MKKQGYKQSSFGWIPNDWEVVRLDRVIDLINGKAFKPGDWGKSGLPIIRIQNLNDQDADFNYYSKPVEGRYYVNKGDLLFAWSGTKGVSFGVRKWEKQQAILNQHIFKISIKGEKLLYEYTFLVLKFVQSNIEEKAHGFKSSFVHVKKHDLDKTGLPLPPLPEQRRIAAILTTWDTAIAKQQQLIDALQIRHRALMQQMLSGKKRLKGLRGRWKVVKAKEIFINSSTKNNGDEELLSATQERGIIPRDMLEGRVTMPSGETNSYKLVEPGDFVISLRSFQGGLEYSQYRGLVSPAYTILKYYKPLNRDFFRFYFKSTEFISRLSVAVIGIRDGKQISYEDFCGIKVPFPNLEEQIAIGTILRTSENEIQTHRRRLAALQQQKRGLMQVLLTGKVRVNVTEL